ncbi:MAG: cytochrome b [Rhodospirillaceae bacterium]|jgi:cytochrome b561|nr:cytochrome b [Rhodospirillaceae bacterium]MBT4118013.1 cytochrome b [Rhodospirillaceae bacterium]
MQLRDGIRNFGTVSIVNHWITALLIVAVFAVAILMDELPRGQLRSDMRALHNSLGIILLVLAATGISWRLISGFPESADNAGPWLRRITRAWHIGLLALIAAMPATGWVAADSGRRAIEFFGLFTMPDVIATNRGLHRAFEEVHVVVSYLLIPLLVVHILAALKHHYFDHDVTLTRMLRVRKVLRGAGRISLHLCLFCSILSGNPESQ